MLDIKSSISRGMHSFPLGVAGLSCDIALRYRTQHILSRTLDNFTDFGVF